MASVTGFCRLFTSFARDNKGNISMIFGLSLLPVMALTGSAVDYSQANRIRTQLQAAADAAAIGAVARYSPGMIAAQSMSGDGTVPAGVTDAQNIFNALMTTKTGFAKPVLTITVKKTGTNVTATVGFTTTVPTQIVSAIGISAMTVSGTSTAMNGAPTYIDFYLLLDNTPSMGVGATPSDVATMVSNTPDQCAFACHDTSNPSGNYYTLAKNLGVTTRIDVVRSATQQLMDTANSSQSVSGQYRMAIYTFGADASSAGLTAITNLTSNLSSAKSAAAKIDLMTVPYQNYNGDQDTDYDDTLAAINQAISTPGTGGTAATPQKYLFFVTDGVADESNSITCSQPLASGGRCQEPVLVSLCSAIKKRGINIAILYTTYLALPTNAWYNQWIAPFNSGPYNPSVNSNIALNMQSCASPGLYFEVSPTDGIAGAMNALFQKAVAQARLTQ